METDPVMAAAGLIAAKRNVLIFTGAGVSVESGIPPFRGAGGLWRQMNPDLKYALSLYISRLALSLKRTFFPERRI